MTKLSRRHESFCLEYVKHLNGKRAATSAGYSENTARAAASRLLTNDNVLARIDELQSVIAKRAEIKAVDILRELARIGYSDIRDLFQEDGRVKEVKDWPEDLARAIASIEVLEEFDGHGKDRVWVGYTKKVKFWDKTKSLELLGRHMKLFEGVPANAAETKQVNEQARALAEKYKARGSK